MMGSESALTTAFLDQLERENMLALLTGVQCTWAYNLGCSDGEVGSEPLGDWAVEVVKME